MSQKDWDDVLQQREAIINGDCFAYLWNIEDIKEVASSYYGSNILFKQQNLSTELAKKVLAEMKASYDRKQGLNWDRVSYDIAYVIRQEEENSDV